MQIRDLGALNGPVLLFGGVYGNVQALEAVLEMAAKLGAVPVCTGDIVAYCADGEACCQIFRRAGIATIAGNCERNLAAGAADCGCGFESGTTCDRLSAQWFAHARASLSAESLRWMQGLPAHIVFSHQGRRYGVLHGGADDIARFVWPAAPDVAAQCEQADSALGPLAGIIAGHCGLGFRQGRWANAGAIGMPPNDGAPKTRYAILQAGALRFHALDYDHASARASMQACGLVQGYEQCLHTGLWPSQDALPPRLRRPSPFLSFPNTPG